MKQKKYYIQNKDLISKKNNNQLIIVNKKDGTFTKIEELTLFIWEMLESKKTFNKILEEILENYDVEKETASRDLSEFLKVATENKIIKTVDK